MQLDTIPDLPEIDETKYIQENEETALTDFKKSGRKLMMYENEEGNLCFLFKNLDHVFYASFLAALSRPDVRIQAVNDYLKLCLEGVRLMKQLTKKGHLNAVRIEKFLQKSDFKNK